LAQQSIPSSGLCIGTPEVIRAAIAAAHRGDVVKAVLIPRQ
jgi:hypothetical protein